MNKIPLLLLLATVTVLSLACAPGEATAPDEEPAATEAPGSVTYEPAYPDEVSTEGLSEEDAAHQDTHADGEEHDHDDDSHSHGPDDPDGDDHDG